MEWSATARPLSLRVSVTDRCQLRCVYCMPEGGVPKLRRDEVLSFEEIVRFVGAVRWRFEVSKVRITGGEPLQRPGIVELVGMLAREGIRDLALTTNAQRLAEMAAELKRAGLRRVNVSLDSLDDATFRALTRGGRLRRTLEGIEAALRHGLGPVKVNAVVLRGCNDGEVVELARFGLRNGCQVRFLELMPIGCARPLFSEMFVPASEVRARLEESFSLEPLPCEAGGTSRDFLARDSRGRRGIVGLISAQTQPFCAGCARVRLTSTGRLISCLARGGGPNVRELLRDDSPGTRRALCELVAAELRRKTDRAAFDTIHPMASVGG